MSNTCIWLFYFVNLGFPNPVKMKKFAFFRVLLAAILVLLVVCQSGCKKDKDETVPETPSTYDIPETTKLISDQKWDEYIVSLDSSSWTITFKSSIKNDYDLITGDILFISKGQGQLRKILSINEEGSELVITTIQATIVEAWPNGRLSYRRDLTEDLKKAKLIPGEGVTIIKTSKDENRETFTVEWEKEIYDHVSLNGVLEFSPEVYIFAVWHGLTPDTVILTLTTTETLEINSTVNIASLELKKEISLVTIPLPPIWVAGTPVKVTPVFEIILGANLDIKSEVSTGVTQMLSFTSGFQYINGDVSIINEMDKNLQPLPPTLTNTLNAKAFIKPELNMIIDNVISPYFNLEMYGELEAELGTTPWWTLYGGLKSRTGFKLGIWGWIIHKEVFTIGIDIFDYKIPLADAEGHINTFPDADFLVSPENGSVGTIFHFDASGCSDEEDETSELKVRWDWENDGDWDTQYSTNKEAAHVYSSAGNYTVTLEVIDTEGAMDLTSEQINVSQNTIPVAVFDVEPESGAIGTVFYFDYSESHDEEDGLTYLEFRWDWEGDGIWDTEFEDYDYDEKTHIYTQAGDYNVKLQVKDTDGAIGDAVQIVTVLNSHAPVASFTIDPQTGNTATVFTFDASGSYDEEDPVEVLQVRWNWNNNTDWDTDWSTNKIVEHEYSGSGTKIIKLIVKDSDGNTNITSRELTVEEFDGVPCPGIPTVIYGGQVYHTVLIGDQCWLKENLNIGARIPISSAQTDNGVIEKYCYEDDENYCDVYGALYQWNELMQYIETPGSQGLCPESWHVPTDGDWKVLEGTVDSLYGIGDPEWDKTGYRGFNAGLYLKSDQWWFNSGNGIDKHGYTVFPAGYGNINTGNFYGLGKEGYFWTSTKGNNNGTAFNRKFKYNNDKIHRYSYSVYMTYGYSVRCLKDQ